MRSVWKLFLTDSIECSVFGVLRIIIGLTVETRYRVHFIVLFLKSVYYCFTLYLLKMYNCVCEPVMISCLLFTRTLLRIIFFPRICDYSTDKYCELLKSNVIFRWARFSKIFHFSTSFISWMFFLFFFNFLPLYYYISMYIIMSRTLVIKL